MYKNLLYFQARKYNSKFLPEDAARRYNKYIWLHHGCAKKKKQTQLA